MMITDQLNMLIYPYSYIYMNKGKILLWQTGEGGPDSFVLNCKNQLISADTEENMKKLLGDKSGRIQWSEPAEINFDLFWKALKNLRVNRASSAKTCKLLLDGWNFIEDLLTTYQCTDEVHILQSPLLNKVYKKLFAGSNLPSVTPEGKSYAPLWLPEEISAIRDEFRHIWGVLDKYLT